MVLFRPIRAAWTLQGRAAPTRSAALAGVGSLTLIALLGQTGCKGCDKPEPAPAGAETPAPTAVPALVPTPAVALAEPATVDAPPSYPGPRSESIDGWRITTGFATAKDEPLPQPRALDDVRVFVTVLDDQQRPVGKFDRFERGEMHGFLVARDLRHALYSFAEGAVAEYADARRLQFRPPEGGDHALLTVFKPAGGTAKMVSTPLSVQGALPEVMGPGVEGMTSRARSGTEELLLSTEPAAAAAGQPVTLVVHDLDTSGQRRGVVMLPFALIANAEMGWGSVIEWTAGGRATWTPKWPGTYLVLAPPTRGDHALAFRLVVHPAGRVAVPPAGLAVPAAAPVAPEPAPTVPASVAPAPPPATP